MGTLGHSFKKNTHTYACRQITKTKIVGMGNKFKNLKLVNGSKEATHIKWKAELDAQKQQVRDTIKMYEQDELDIAEHIRFLEMTLAKTKQSLIDKKDDLTRERERLLNFDSSRHLEIKCRGFPKEQCQWNVYHGMGDIEGMAGKKNRMEVSGVTVNPRGFQMMHVYEFDFEPTAEIVKMEFPSHELLTLDFNVPQEYKEWHNKEK